MTDVLLTMRAGDDQYGQFTIVCLRQTGEIVARCCCAGAYDGDRLAALCREATCHVAGTAFINRRIHLEIFVMLHTADDGNVFGAR